jgi:periplasmic protein TonB
VRTDLRWLLSLGAAAALHAGGVALLRSAPSAPASVELAVVVSPAPPAPPATPASPPISAPGPARRGSGDGGGATPVRRPARRATARPASGGGVAVADTQDLLVRLGRPGGGAPAPPPRGAVTPPRPLADYARAQVAYPREAIDSLAAGEVRLELDIDAEGRVTRIAVVASAGHGFDELATELARSYRFAPARDEARRPVGARVGWRMAFAAWRPMSTGSPPVVAGEPTLLEPPPAAAAPPPPLTREAVEARPIASLDETERQELCRWQIRVRGGVHADRCPAPAPPPELAGAPAEVRRGHWVVAGYSPRVARFAGSPRPRFRVADREDFMIFVKPELECVEETHRMDGCAVTVGEYVACMVALASRPCDFALIEPCARISRRCDYD